MQSFDVVVLGGGPAGCATALSLRREAPSITVAVVEGGGYAARRIGETLPPNIDALLTHLGIWQSFLDTGPKAAFGTRACWGSEEVLENEFIFQKEGRGWHLDRLEFDRMMACEAERAGVRFYTDSRLVSHQRAGETWTLALEHGGKNEAAECRFVVDATGRNSSFATQQNARHVEYDRLAGWFFFFEDGVEPTDSFTLVESFEHGWIYSAALPGGGLVAAILSDTDILRGFDLRSRAGWRRVLDHTPETRKRLRGANPHGEPLIRSAASRQLDAVVGDGWVAVGDAASSFDPLSSQGVYKAIRSGIFASYTIVETLGHKGEGGRARYQRFVRDEYNEYLDVRAAYYAQEQRWPDVPFWKRRHEQITLSPSQMIQASSSDGGRHCMHLTTAEINLVRDVCGGPSPAHEVVAELIKRSSRSVTHRRAVLAVQKLLSAGLVRAI